MNILFDLELKDLDFWDKCNKEELTVLKEIWDYTYNRISILQSEIEKEDIINGYASVVVIYLKETPKKIQPRGYNDILSKKIIDSFSENDRLLMWEKANNSLMRLLN